MKMVLVSLFTLFLFAVLFGCSRSAPSCGDESTKALVIKIATQEAKHQLKNSTSFSEGRIISDAQWEKDWSRILPTLKMTVESIRVKNFDKNIGTYQCAAILKVTINDEMKELPISYTSELAQDKKDAFFVEVYGLKR